MAVADQITQCANGKSAKAVKKSLSDAWDVYGEEAFAAAMRKPLWSVSTTKNMLDAFTVDVQLLLTPAQALASLPDPGWAERLAPMVPKKEWSRRVAVKGAALWVSEAEAAQGLGIRSIGPLLCVCFKAREGGDDWISTFRTVSSRCPPESLAELHACVKLMGAKTELAGEARSWLEASQIRFATQPQADRVEKKPPARSKRISTRDGQSRKQAKEAR